MPTLPLGVTPAQGLAAVAAGLLGAAAFWPLSLWPLLPVSLCLFLWVVGDADAAVARNVGMVYGTVFGAGTMYWMFLIFGVFAVPLVLLMGIYFLLLGWLLAATRGVPWPGRAALVALFAVGIEWLRGDAWYLRFPWYTPPHALAAYPPLVSGVRWLGVYGLSYVVWLIAAAGALGRPVWWVAFVVLPAGWLFLPGDGEPDRRVLLIQTEADNPPPGRIIAGLPDLTVDLAVLPELAYRETPASVLALKNGPGDLARKASCPVVFGAVEGLYPRMPFGNVACVVGPDGTLLGTWQKHRPVPLFADGVPGTGADVFAVEQGVLGVAICYDFDAPGIAGSLAAAGATVLVAPSMDAMSWSRAQHEHHALLFRLRAIENDRWLLRASSSGRTEVVSPRGLPSAEGVAIGATGHGVLPFAHRDTFALGGRLWWLGPAAAFGTVLYLVVRVVVAWRTRREPEPTETSVSDHITPDEPGIVESGP